MTTDAILAHAAEEAPGEACGLVIKNSAGEHYMPCRNLAADPLYHFEISPDAFLMAGQQGEVVAVVHSHPGGEPFLSTADRIMQVNSGLPWLLVCHGAIRWFEPVPLLLGRTFEHGVTDCYSLFRDAYHLAGITLPDFVRQDDWWRRGEELYLDNMAENDFFRVKKDICPGDVILFCYASSRANHAAVYLGDQTLLHHIPNQLSKREVLNERWQRMMHSVWRSRAWQPSAFTGICNDLAAGLR